MKAVYNSCKLQKLLQFAKFLFMYSVNHTSIIFLLKHLHTGIAILTNVCYQMKCFSGDIFSFFQEQVFLTYLSPTFLISCEVQTRFSKILKYFEQYIRNLLSGTKVRIWIDSEYDAVFNFSCIASSNLSKTFNFFYMTFLS